MLHLDNWIKRKLNISDSEPLTRSALEHYQLAKLNETLSLAIARSSFYRQLLTPFTGLTTLMDMQALPFTSPTDLSQQELNLLCVKPNHISRIVTMNTSGTAGPPKRIHFTEEDQALTIDYFYNGMKYMLKETDKLLILMPCKIPGSIGLLLSEGITRLGAIPFNYGLLQSSSDYEKVLSLIIREGINCVVGLPSQVAQLAQKSICTKPTSNNDSLQNSSDAASIASQIQKTLQTVLLSAEYVSPENVQFISQAWDCEVYEHFGMTEMGLGCAVSCKGTNRTIDCFANGKYAPIGYHVRENDLYIEIINPNTGALVSDGEFGELVFTTLTRKGMPFIRYRTADISRWLTAPCSCGSVLKRLDRVLDRVEKKAMLFQTHT